MSEFRIPLEGGSVLVVTLEVEEAQEPDAQDAEMVGSALLAALGLKRPVATKAAPVAAKKRKSPPEEGADDWLVRTSRESYRK